MKKKINICTALFVILTAVSVMLYKITSGDVFLTIAITAGTFSYHLIMRLTVGFVFNKVMKNQADYSKSRYRTRKWENSLYKKLKVRKWKDRMPTYDKSLFDLKQHSLEEIIEAGCQAELVHETIMILSFVPILAGIRFGAYPVFIITSVISAAFDGIFVIIQRYNRPRLLRVIRKKAAKGN